MFALRKTTAQHHKIEEVLDHRLIREAFPALELHQPVGIKSKLKNTVRTTGAMLSGELARRYGEEGMPDHTIYALFEG